MPPLPVDIPKKPEEAYKFHGWRGMPDWLGAKPKRGRDTRTGSRSFVLAREFVWRVGLLDYAEWRLYCRGRLSGKGERPGDIPARPDVAYKHQGWISWADWLGTATVAFGGKSYLPFPMARECARKLGLTSETEWYEYCRRVRGGARKALPQGVPLSPEKVFEHVGWRGWRDWLVPPGGSRQRLRQFRNYADACRFVHRLSLRSHTEWRMYCRGEMPDKPPLPLDIPAGPRAAYRGRGWTTWGDWFGTGFVATRQRVYRPFAEARRFVRGLRLRNMDEWNLYCKGELPDKGTKPADIPADPFHVYKAQGWKGADDWFGRKIPSNINRVHRPFADARRFVRMLRLRNENEWRLYTHGKLPGKPPKPLDIPATPDWVYRNEGWSGWGYWLGTGLVVARRRSYRPFDGARRFARRLRLGSIAEWRWYCSGGMPELGRKPADIPATPQLIYQGKGWTSWRDWLGSGDLRVRYPVLRPFAQARDFARGLGLSNRAEWLQYCRGGEPELEERPGDIPRGPHVAYRDTGWTGWGDWLGTGGVASQRRKPRPYAAARAYVRDLALTSSSEWRQYCAGRLPHLGKKPDDIPRHADAVYRNAGWVSWRDWLGTPEVRRARQGGRHITLGR
ncbi:MAG: hypothetical protein A3K19_03470 [Lentisphaerae bacterium RIFOXYB12_FULL_65_16]|nr:MAG: hypothetical protein A3K18_01250 [Lentisphaerae bacterium RIFOXYA12_64_32]OGV86627.1 MAG: hypothetical protein A3K19_03470 [Lentisphaerae bacterium RIFOXYB12_FULL_65_16]